MKITIKGNEYGLQWGMGAIELYCDAMDCEIEGLDKVYMPNREQGKALTNLILAGLKNHAELNNEDMPVTYRELQAWIDDTEQDTFKAVMDDWNKSKYLGKTISSYLIGEPEEGSAKKKSRSVKS